MQRAGSGDWRQVKRLDTSLCTGDRLRTGPLSRAALFLQPETLVRVDDDTTIALSLTTAEIVVEFFSENVPQAGRDAHSCGAGYFITRFPRKFRVSAPHLNAAVEGTEFQVTLRCDSTELAVLEGEVRSETVAAREERIVTAGQRLVASPAAPAAFSTLIKPTDAVQWVLYYPPLSDAKAEADIPAREQCRALPAPSDQACLSQRAEVLLRVGRIDEALQDVDEVLRVNPASGDANALRAIIQIAKNDKAAALESANAATAASPGGMRAWLALSYAQQASFQVAQALESAKRAQALEPNSSLVNARVAELFMSLGLLDEAEAAARTGVAANPAESAAHTMLGFVHLAQIDTRQARADFQTAIESDSFNPLARLGLGLARIRDGELVEGRQQLEIAVALDPTNSLLRSYVGKAYFEENHKERDALADTQFGLAKQLDRNDPTPWFYGAILEQTQNQPVTALEYLHTSVRKNNDRAVYRSRLLLDDDVAARTASIAAMYSNLGFEKLSVVESIKAISENFGNSSAHRLLATAYGNIPRHDVARVSEALQAQIRQPVSLSPVPPLLSTDNLAILRDVGPSRLGTSEYNALYSGDGARVDVDALWGERGTFGDQFLATALQGSWAVALSQLHYETDGFIDNDAAEKDIYDLFAQYQIAPSSSIQLDVKRSEFEIGETFFRFDPENPLPVTIEEESDSYRLSGHHGGGSGNAAWVWSAIYEDRSRLVRFQPDGTPITGTEADAYAGEVQRAQVWGDIETIVGAGYIEDDSDFPLDLASGRSTAGNAYVYGRWRSPSNDLSIHAGLSADRYRQTFSSPFDPVDPLTRERLNPKIGVVWSPRPGSTLRAAGFSTVTRPLVASQTIEPTQVAGFNQFFSGFEQLYGDVEGTVSRRAGLAFDQSLSETAFAGVEIAKRKLDVPSINLHRDFTWREETGSGYLYKTFAFPSLERWSAAAAVEGEYERIERPQILVGSEGIVDLKTVRVPIGLRLFSDQGLTLRVATTYVKQSGTFSIDEGFPTFQEEDDAWITDAAVEYRLPRRRGLISIGVRNMTDEFIDLLEVDPLNPRVATRRFAFVKVRLTI